MRLEKDPGSPKWPRGPLSNDVLLGAIILDGVIQRATTGRLELVIKHIRDGAHKPGSLHYPGDAFDFETNEMLQTEKTEIVMKGRAALGPDFDLIFETTHGHCEFQPKTPY